jgi:hypothetical protein
MGVVEDRVIARDRVIAVIGEAVRSTVILTHGLGPTAAGWSDGEP